MPSNLHVSEVFKMAKGSSDTYEFEVIMLSSIFWADFYKHADMPVDADCFYKLAELGVLAKIVENLEEFMKFGDVFDAGLHCCGKAGKESKSIASTENSDSVTPDICERAFKKVAGALQKVRARAGELETQGPLC